MDLQAEAPRWSPTPEQLRHLMHLFDEGLVRRPSSSQIRDITSHLSAYGHIQEQNISNWFQNRRSREKMDERNKRMAGLAAADDAPCGRSSVPVDADDATLKLFPSKKARLSTSQEERSSVHHPSSSSCAAGDALELNLSLSLPLPRHNLNDDIDLRLTLAPPPRPPTPAAGDVAAAADMGDPNHNRNDDIDLRLTLAPPSQPPTPAAGAVAAADIGPPTLKLSL